MLEVLSAIIVYFPTLILRMWLMLETKIGIFMRFYNLVLAGAITTREHHNRQTYKVNAKANIIKERLFILSGPLTVMFQIKFIH